MYLNWFLSQTVKTSGELLVSLMTPMMGDRLTSRPGTGCF